MMNELYSEVLSVFSARSLTAPRAFAAISTTNLGWRHDKERPQFSIKLYSPAPTYF